MNGIEILASEEVAIAWANWNWGSFLGVAIIMLLTGALIGTILALKEKDIFFGLLVFTVIFVIGTMVFGTILAKETGAPTKYVTQYKVTIDDSVSLAEFMDKYEIIDQEGKIYTVREK